MNIQTEFSENGVIVLKNSLSKSDFSQIDELLKALEEIFINDPYSENCADFAKEKPNIVTSIYSEVANLKECIHIARLNPIKNAIQSLIGADAKIYQRF